MPTCAPYYLHVAQPYATLNRLRHFKPPNASSLFRLNLRCPSMQVLGISVDSQFSHLAWIQTGERPALAATQRLQLPNYFGTPSVCK